MKEARNGCHMYSLSQLQKGIANPSLAKRELTKQAWKVHSTVTRRLLGREDPLIPERDWDNLLLLDACRYDLFEKHSDLPGELKEYYSVASNTAEYVQKTFKNEYFGDIVCVTSTPKYYKPNVEDSFHDIIHVWKDDWDEDYRTVLPEVMNKRVLEAHRKYPQKRVLAHYIPPHQPFIGETGQQLPHEVQFSGEVIQMDKEKPNVWEALRQGAYTRERVWQAYSENLQLTLPAIKEILEKLPGKTVVTSDHGNVFGQFSEFGVIGHPPYRHIQPLIKVPWLVYQNGERKEIVAEEGETARANTDSSVVKDRLSDLGYVG